MYYYSLGYGSKTITKREKTKYSFINRPKLNFANILAKKLEYFSPNKPFYKRNVSILYQQYPIQLKNIYFFIYKIK